MSPEIEATAKWCIHVIPEFATSSRRLPTKIWKLNMLRIYPVELSCVGGVYTHTRRLSWPSLQFCSVYVTGAENWKLGHDWRLVRSHRRLDATRLRCRQIVQTRRDSSRLSPTILVANNSIHTAYATQLDSWVASASAVCIGHKQDVCPSVMWRSCIMSKWLNISKCFHHLCTVVFWKIIPVTEFRRDYS